MPTEKSLASLPYFAILAVGARAARTVESIFREWPAASEEQVGILDGALKAIETLALSGNLDSREVLWVPTADAALRAADVASEADEAEAPLAALLAADSVAELADAIDPAGDCVRAARAVRRSIDASTKAIVESGRGDLEEFRGCLEEYVQQLGTKAYDA